MVSGNITNKPITNSHSPITSKQEEIMKIKLLFTFSLILFIFYCSATLSAGEFNYYIRDHLGNTRVVLDEDGSVKEYYDYYPFGLNLRESISGSNKARYKFTGKELDDENGVGWYYFGARYYDAGIGRWLTTDLLAEKYPNISPYVYSLNNPLKYIDPDGNVVITAFSGLYYQSDGGYKLNINEGTTGQLITNLNNWAAKNSIEDFNAVGFASPFNDKTVLTQAADFIKSNLSEGEPLIVYGYSWGGDTSVELAEMLQSKNISVDLLLTVDAAKGPLSSTVDRQIPGNVKENINWYQTTPSKHGSRGGMNSAKKSNTIIINIIFDKAGQTNHGNIDEQLLPIIEEIIKNTIINSSQEEN